MGGNLAITIREEDGTEHRMDRWTNSMPYFINNMGLVNKDPEYLRDYLATWYDFVDDWNENAARYDQEKAAAKEKYGKEYYLHMPDVFRHNMTPAYADHPYLAPSEYGQVVVDYKTNKILHAQGYTGFGAITRVCACNDVAQDGDRLFWEKGEYSGYPYALREFFEAGRLRIESYLRPEYRRLEVGELTKIEDLADSQALLDYLKLRSPLREEQDRQFSEDYDAFVKWKEETGEECDFRDWRKEELGYNPEEDPIWPDDFCQFVLDMSPFEIIRYPETKQGFQDLRQAIVDLGFELSDHEKELWDDYLSRRYPPPEPEEETDAGESISGQSESEG